MVNALHCVPEPDPVPSPSGAGSSFPSAENGETLRVREQSGFQLAREQPPTFAQSSLNRVGPHPLGHVPASARSSLLGPMSRPHSLAPQRLGPRGSCIGTCGTACLRQSWAEQGRKWAVLAEHQSGSAVLLGQVFDAPVR